MITMMGEDKGSKRKRLNELSSPPGFVSLTSFKLKRVESHDEACGFMSFQNDSNPDPAHNVASSIFNDVEIEKLEKSLKQKPWILHNRLVDSEKSDMEHLVANVFVEQSLPKGVIRGCSSCNDCQKVVARWRPEEACRPIVEYAPVFHPTEEEFKDTLQYFAKIREKAEKYGICRIVPPDSWQPPCLFKEKQAWEASKFSTHVQKINELPKLYSQRKLHAITEKMKGNRSEADGFEFERGPEFTLRTFRAYAKRFTGPYFQGKDIFTGFRAPYWEIIEGEYWRIIQNPTEEIEVLSGHNLGAEVLGSGFPLPSSTVRSENQTEYMKSGWNLNNTPKLHGSLLAFESCVGSATSVPRVDVGMCFSSLCWKVEEHHLYSFSYMHLGDSKVWYGIPGSYYLKCEAALKKTFPELSEHPKLFHKLVTQLSPSILKSEGIPVYRCVQNPRQFVLIFPGAYHSGFDCGFNVSERVNLAPLNWLPHGQMSVEIYSDLHRKTSISYDKLLVEGARDILKALWHCNVTRNSEQWRDACGKHGWLLRALKYRVKRERLRRECLCNPSALQRMENEFGSTMKKECIICLYDLYLSAARCPCSPDRYSCLEHSKQLCRSCPWSSRTFLFRYDIDELNLLIDALEGKLNAFHKWTKENSDYCAS